MYGLWRPTLKGLSFITNVIETQTDDFGDHCVNDLYEMFDTEENEERSMIEPRSFEEPKLKELIAVLIEWINDELADQRIIVKDIEEDLYDGQVLQKLLGKLSAYYNE
jgi:hypothetical protein